MTQTANVVGTVVYMSPEQAGGGQVGPASDVFSFGMLPNARRRVRARSGSDSR